MVREPGSRPIREIVRDTFNRYIPDRVKRRRERDLGELRLLCLRLLDSPHTYFHSYGKEGAVAARSIKVSEGRYMHLQAPTDVPRIVPENPTIIYIQTPSLRHTVGIIEVSSEGQNLGNPPKLIFKQADAVSEDATRVVFFGHKVETITRELQRVPLQ